MSLGQPPDAGSFVAEMVDAFMALVDELLNLEGDLYGEPGGHTLTTAEFTFSQTPTLNHNSI